MTGTGNPVDSLKNSPTPLMTLPALAHALALHPYKNTHRLSEWSFLHSGSSASKIPAMQDVTLYDPSALDKSRKGLNQRSANAVADCFDLIGGVPRLAIWADENPTDFYTKIWNRTIPSKQETDVSGEVRITCAIAPSALDGVEYTDVTPGQSEDDQ